MTVRLLLKERDGLFYITFTCLNWLPLFELTNSYDAVYKWFDYLKSKGHFIKGYVIMPNHLHALIALKNTNQSINTIISNGKRFIAYELVKRLKEQNQIGVLNKLSLGVSPSDRKRGKLHQVFEPSFDCKECYTESFTEQKLNYIHQNPCKGIWNLAVSPIGYKHSSAKFYHTGEKGVYEVMNYRELRILTLLNDFPVSLLAFTQKLQKGDTGRAVKIKHLASLRERLVETKKRLINPIKEFEEVGDLAMAKMLAKTIKSSLTAIDKDLNNIEGKIKEIVNDDDVLKQLYKLITSVVGIGFVTAINLLVHTNGFTVMKDVRKLACYCGVAPFEYSSGSSIRGRTKVHFMANRKPKCNLHMASLSAVKLDADLKHYYERKVAEGKSKLSVLNAVKNKLLARVIAVVNKQELYVKKAV